VLAAPDDQAALDPMSDSLNDANIATTALTVAADANVLVRDSAAQVYLVVRYHLDN
jgi:hypothetical protein